MVPIFFKYLCSMILTDTHTHLYLEQFDADRGQAIQNALERGVKYMLMPNIDSSSLEGLHALADRYPSNCFPMMGLHPTSVKENFEEELQIVEEQLGNRTYYAIGETGIDLYWDKSFQAEQEIAFSRQIELAAGRALPIVIHQRNSWDEILDVLRKTAQPKLKGVFHCFSGNEEQAREVIEMGFMLGIGGVLTFKNSKLYQTIEKIGMEHLLLETDSPFLAPHPYRGKRNESAYTYLVAQRLAEVKNMPVEEIAATTTDNAKRMFEFPEV